MFDDMPHVSHDLVVRPMIQPKTVTSPSTHRIGTVLLHYGEKRLCVTNLGFPFFSAPVPQQQHQQYMVCPHCVIETSLN